MPLNLKNPNLEKSKEILKKILEIALVVIKSKYTISTLVWMFVVYFMNPFGIFDSAEIREQKLRAKTNEFINSYVIEKAEALEKIADSETSVQDNISDLNTKVEDINNKICWLKSQFDNLEIDLDKTCWQTNTTNVEAKTTEVESKEEVKKEIASLEKTIKYYKEDYPFEKFNYYTTSNQCKKRVLQKRWRKYNRRLNKDLKAQDFVELKGNTSGRKSNRFIK